MDRVVVFLDWQNVYMNARSTFHRNRGPVQLGNVYPTQLGQRLAQARPGRELTEVRVYRGQPDSTRDPKSYGANRRQQAAWERAGAKVTQRTLRYPTRWPDERAEEKGIDVAIAVDLVMMAVAKEYDVGILMSTDTDLKPALEAVASLVKVQSARSLPGKTPIGQRANSVSPESNCGATSSTLTTTSLWRTAATTRSGWNDPAGTDPFAVAACQSRPGVGVAWRWSPPGRHHDRLPAASGGAVAHVGPVKGPDRTLGAGDGHVGEVENDAGDPKQDRGSND